jgi:two-component system, LytTR family, response regulator
MYNVIIIEDDRNLAQALIKVIHDVAPQFEIKGTAPSIEEAKLLIETIKPDIAFMDVELQDGLSFELLEQIPEITFEVIFVTAFSQYAIDAFKYSAIDFILKPIDPDDIALAAKKVTRSLEMKDIDLRIKNLLYNKTQEPVNQRIILQTSGSVHYVKMKDIIRCESDVNYTTFFLTEGKPIVVSKTIGEFERMLPPYFFRTHRSHLVNLNYIEEVKKRTGIVILSNKEKIEISSRRKEAFLEALKEYFN